MIRLVLALATVLILVMLALTMLPRSLRTARDAARVQSVAEEAKKETGAPPTPGPPAAGTPAAATAPTTINQELRALKRDVQQTVDDAAKAREQEAARYRQELPPPQSP